MPDPIEGKIISFLHGEPTITYTKKEFEKLSIRQNLPFAGVAKFSYVRPYLNELRKILPIQLEIKGTCPMGYLDERRILLRLSLLEDYATLLSKACELKVRNRYFPIRFLKWDPWFNPEEETTIAIGWISFPGLPTNLFDKESMFSLASAVGTPLIIDKGTHNRTRPSCARVKVEVDLLKELPKRIQINCVDAETGEVKSKWQKIQYDYLPKYCTQCKLQGHDLNGCWVLHPQHRTKKEEQRDEKKELEKGKAKEESSKQNGKQDSKEATHNGVYRNGKLVYENWNVVQNRKNKGNGKETEQQRGNKAKEPTTTNKFGTLVDLTEEMQEETNMVNKSNGDLKETSRPWVDKVFRKMDDQANDIENSSKEDAVKVNQSNEGNSKEKSDSANSDEQQGNTSKEQQTNLKGKSHSNIEEQEVNTQNSECPREAAECPVQFNNQQQVQKFSPIHRNSHQQLNQESIEEGEIEGRPVEKQPPKEPPDDKQTAAAAPQMCHTDVPGNGSTNRNIKGNISKIKLTKTRSKLTPTSPHQLKDKEHVWKWRELNPTTSATVGSFAWFFVLNI